MTGRRDPLDQLRADLAYARALVDGMPPPAPVTPDGWAPYALGGLLEAVRIYLERVDAGRP